MLRKLHRSDEGQALVEYALVIALIAVTLMTVLVLFRNSTGQRYDSARTAVNGAGQSSYGAALSNAGTGDDDKPDGGSGGNAGGNGKSNAGGNGGGNGGGKNK